MNAKVVSLFVVALSINGIAKAESVNWNGDVMKGFRAAMAERPIDAPKAKAVNAAARIYGLPQGSNQITRDTDWTDIYYIAAQSLSMNKAGKLEASLQVCTGYGSPDTDGGPVKTCSTIVYGFAQVSIDAGTQEVRFGSEVIGRVKKFLGKSWVSLNHYTARSNKKIEKTGRTKEVNTFEFYLERN